MDLQKKSFTELKALFDKTFKDWQQNNYLRGRVQSRELVKYSDFSRARADLKQLMRENAKLHDLMIRIDLELQLRTWTGKND